MREFSDLDRRVLLMLASGPKSRPDIEVTLGINATQSQRALKRLREEGKVELAPDVGPATYRRTNQKEST